MQRILGVIPARLESARLPGKPMRWIAGRPMIAWVYERTRQATSLQGLLVATDSPEIETYCRAQKIPVMMTSRAHRSGTDRVVEVMAHEPADIYVNIQGDEPMITPDHMERLLRPFEGHAGAEVSTLKVALDAENARDPNQVKVVTDRKGHALYFSRAPIPYGGDADSPARYYKHLGIYAFTAGALGMFHGLAPGPLEQSERLEQLRWLENGIPMVVVETPHDTIGVDTEEDLAKVEAYFRGLEQKPER